MLGTKFEAPLWKKIAYLVAWPGLHADAFLAPDFRLRKPSLVEWTLAVVKLLAGLFLLFGVARWVRAYPYTTAWIGMTGVVMILHFGIFRLLSCGWRAIGVNATPLMNSPLLASSVSEFWSRRWNTAFRDLTHIFLFRPLGSKFGYSRALFAGFLISGMVHDLVISLPAGGGYGGPTLYFSIQGAAIFVERSTSGRSVNLGKGIRGRLFTMGSVLLPLYFLFHPPFLTMIILPFLGAIGAL